MTREPGAAHRRATAWWFLLYFAAFLLYAAWHDALGARCLDRGGVPGVLWPSCSVPR